MMDRREFVKQLSTGMGAALTPGVMGAILSGCQPEAEPGSLLAARDAEILGSLADAIIPRTETPGAIDAGVPQYIEMMLEHFTPAEHVETFRAQLEWISSWLAGQDVRRLEDVSADKLTGFLTDLDNQAFGDGAAGDVPPGEPPLFAVLKPLTVAGFYTSQVGAQQELHQTPFGEYRELPFDEVGKTWA